MEDRKITFILGDRLPTKYDVVISLFSIASKPKSSKMKEAIFHYAAALMNMWEKAFTLKHVMSRRSVTIKLEKLVDEYYRLVYNKGHRSTSKYSGEDFHVQTIRVLNRKWRLTVNEKTGQNNDSLFDIGRNMLTGDDKLKGKEKDFYEDQKDKRIG